jgi:hypothetical protein
MNPDDEKRKDELGLKVTQCYLSQYRFIIPCVIIGTILGVKRTKNYQPLLIGVMLGTMADYTYATCIDCKEIEDEYKKLKLQSKANKKY